MLKLIISSRKFKACFTCTVNTVIVISIKMEKGTWAAGADVVFITTTPLMPRRQDENKLTQHYKHITCCKMRADS